MQLYYTLTLKWFTKKSKDQNN